MMQINGCSQICHGDRYHSFINAVGTQVKDESGTLLETGKSICKKEQGRSVWLNAYLREKAGGKTF